MINQKHLRYIIYGIVALFVVILIALIASNAAKRAATEQRIRQEERVQHAMEKAELELKLARQTVALAAQQRAIDSIAHAKSITTIKIKYIEKTKTLDAAMLGIDTIRTNADFGAFSTRKMLSDSAAGQL